MYPGRHATERANQPAVIMAGSGKVQTYAELEARGNRIDGRLDRKGERADRRLDRRGDRFDRRWDRRH